MRLLPAIYRPSGTWWTRTKAALFTAYVNVHIRREERQDAEFYVQIDQMEAR